MSQIIVASPKQRMAIYSPFDPAKRALVLDVREGRRRSLWPRHLHTIKARHIAHIQTDGQVSALFVACCVIVVASFFIAGILVFDVSNTSILGGLTHPTGNRPSHLHLLSPTKI